MSSCWSPRAAVVVMTTLATAAAGAVSAQTLPNRTDAAWAMVGEVSGATYSVLPSSIEREGRVVRFLMRAEVPPPPNSAATNSIVARIIVDCEAETIGRGTSEYYNVTQGFVRAVEEDATLKAVSDPGQTLLIRHVCAD